jgi:hypothetical protein
MASLTLWFAPQLSEPCTLKNPKRPSTGIGSFNFLASFNKKSEKPILLDIGGAVIMSLILFLLLYPLIEGRGAGWPLWMYASMIQCDQDTDMI